MNIHSKKGMYFMDLDLGERIPDSEVPGKEEDQILHIYSSMLKIRAMVLQQKLYKRLHNFGGKVVLYILAHMNNQEKERMR